MSPKLQTLHPEDKSMTIATLPRLVCVVSSDLQEDPRYGGIRGASMWHLGWIQRVIAFGKTPSCSS